MPNVTVPNFVPTPNTDFFQASHWKLSRALKLAGWKYLASSDGTATELLAAPQNDKWGGGVQVGGQTGSGATVSSVTNGRATIVGLSGMTNTGGANTYQGGTGSFGRFLTFSGGIGVNTGTFQIVKFISSTSVVIANPSASVDATSMTWTEKDPLLDTVPTLGTGSWWVAQGPTMMKIPITAAQVAGPNGLFIRGENVTESGSGAAGELVGYFFDVASSTGYLVIAPRVQGSGAGRRGWATASSVITGTLSGATVSPGSHTPVEVVHEIMLARGNSTILGQLAFGAFDAAAEATDRFSAAARLAAATASVGPGQGAGANAFPTNAWMQLGAISNSTAFLWGSNQNQPTIGNTQIIATNMIEDTGISHDGSWVILVGCLNSGGSFVGGAFQRLDDTEDGDVSPYVSVWPNADLASFSTSRTSATHATLTVTNDYWTVGGSQVNFGSASTFRGWRRRLFGSSDSYKGYIAGWVTATVLTIGMIQQNTADPEKIAHALTPTRMREPIWVLNYNTNDKHRKGTFRWLFFVQGGQGTDLWESKKWIEASNSNNPSVVVGPWDGTSTVTNNG